MELVANCSKRTGARRRGRGWRRWGAGGRRARAEVGRGVSSCRWWAQVWAQVLAPRLRGERSRCSRPRRRRPPLSYSRPAVEHSGATCSPAAARRPRPCSTPRNVNDAACAPPPRAPPARAVQVHGTRDVAHCGGCRACRARSRCEGESNRRWAVTAHRPLGGGGRRWAVGGPAGRGRPPLGGRAFPPAGTAYRWAGPPSRRAGALTAERYIYTASANPARPAAAAPAERCPGRLETWRRAATTTKRERREAAA